MVKVSTNSQTYASLWEQGLRDDGEVQKKGEDGGHEMGGNHRRLSCDSVGYRVWDPARKKIFNVVVPHIDENVQPGWWKGDEGGVQSVEEWEIIFPDLDVVEVEKVAAEV